MRERSKIHTELIQSFKKGDRNAYAEIYRLFYPALFNYGKKICSDSSAVEDCIQEVFTSFWVNRAGHEKIVELKSYLFVSFRNLLIRSMARKKQLKESEISDGLTFGLEISADQVMINSEKIYEQNINLRKAIENLTERQKEAVFFRYYENLEYDEIASILNITTKATYKLVARAIVELRTTYLQQLDKVFLTISGLITFL